MLIKVSNTLSGIPEIISRSLIIIGLIYVVSIKIFDRIFSILFMRPSFTGYSVITLLSLFVSGILVTSVMGSISLKLTLPRITRYITLFLILYVVGFTSNIVEYFFSTVSILVFYKNPSICLVFT